MTVLPDLASLGIFAAAALLLLLTPGPAVLYIVARSLEQGRRAGLVSALGVHLGTLVHVAAAGLSAILAASATAFSVVKYLGAAYLRVSRRPESPRAPDGRERRGPPAAAPARLSRRRRGERAEPEDRPLLPRLPAPVRQRLAGQRRGAGAGSGRPVRAARPRHRRRLRADGGHRGPVAPRPPASWPASAGSPAGCTSDSASLPPSRAATASSPAAREGGSALQARQELAARSSSSP
jgi:hypothetical protein